MIRCPVVGSHFPEPLKTEVHRDRIRVIIADIDGGRPRWRFLPVVVPLAEDFIIAPDGSFVGE
jgi:hypothetical protein